MPFESWSQVAWLKHNRPEQYKEWVQKYGLPEHVPQRVEPKPRLKYGHPEIRQAMEDKRRRESGR